MNRYKQITKSSYNINRSLVTVLKYGFSIKILSCTQEKSLINIKWSDTLVLEAFYCSIYPQSYSGETSNTICGLENKQAIKRAQLCPSTNFLASDSDTPLLKVNSDEDRDLAGVAWSRDTRKAWERKYQRILLQLLKVMFRFSKK